MLDPTVSRNTKLLEITNIYLKMRPLLFAADAITEFGHLLCTRKELCYLYNDIDIMSLWCFLFSFFLLFSVRTLTG